MVGVSNDIYDLKLMLSNKIDKSIDKLHEYENCDIECADYDEDASIQDNDFLNTPFYANNINDSLHIKSYSVSTKQLYNLTHDKSIDLTAPESFVGDGVLTLFHSKESTIDITEIINRLKN